MSDDLINVLDKLRAINYQDLDYEIRRLEAIKDWAIEHTGIDYRNGDRVELTRDIPCPGGWAAYEECLVKGATGIVKRIDFGLHHRKWFANFSPDVEWKMWTSGSGEIHRVWNGKLEDIPSGMESMSKFDLEKYPEGKQHTVMFDLDWMKKIA